MHLINVFMLFLPGDYYGRPQGEKDLLWALSSYEVNPPPRGRRRKKAKK